MFRTHKKYRIFVTRRIPKEGIDLLQKHFRVTVSAHDRPLTARELDIQASRADALLTLLTDGVDGAFLRRHKHLRVIANYAVGFDNIDVEVATKLGIIILNTPGVLHEAVAEHALTLLCALSRRIVEADRFVRAGKYHGWSPNLLLGTDFFDATLGVVGLGAIGTSLAQRACQGLGMKILYTDVHPHRLFEKHYNAHYVHLDTLLKHSDFVSVHVPLLPSTHHLFGAREFRLMKKTAYFINTSRGAVVDEKALVKALKAGSISGAALDVFEHEPILASGLTKLENVILTPHIASATRSARVAMAELVASGMVLAFSGRRPRNVVNPEVWQRYHRR